ncbi:MULTISPECIES: TIGR04211 family SH3 domain-containing protein [Halomonas]|jgi:SH3 domain protein|uniref:TIGR04211 family SH3 domain-containing protein n=3 Tax=Halomonas TaxID=2745 RepID=A0AAU7KKC0_9GAMM|nr:MULTISPECIES: TIGR04211 family SH3 domain-containing protein [Halomonas]MBR9771670.1 SH3 domain-containing protein [Gammaproteobacteria bacterium]HAR06870.1 peptide-binding protein [Cobetia sp.]MAR72222.1 peptide-binding protein [Halomonas sp.]MBR9881885.1 SH3 domain-containing protein [Gammaproteobacteria bacterium]MBS8271123.1 SH3 domain-containing protein [Halomonas litopenaei]|tara:strand:+ start:362 stop:988 length:627 start_codon:yes stop_codon:yes gene_type:complete
MKTQFLKTVTLGLALTGAALPAMAQDDGTSRWVSDELTTYVRSGPTDGYRIVGTLTAGQPVTLLDTSGDYSQVRSDSGDVVWVPSSELQQTPSASDQLPKLEARVEELTEELDGINESWEERTRTMTETLEVRESRIAELEARNHELESAFSDISETNKDLEARLETRKEDLLMRYFMYGGGVAGAGLIVGLIVPHLPRRRRKRDRWF